MQAFDYVITLMSFVYALAIAHVLATAGDIIGAWSRVRFSWLNAAWMLFELLAILAWWIGLWGCFLEDLRHRVVGSPSATNPVSPNAIPPISTGSSQATP